MKYTSIKYERDALKKILYMFVCQDDNLEKAYEGDKFMEDVVKMARAISGKEKIPLYLSEDEIRRLDREEAVEEGYTNGYETGKKDGIKENQKEIVLKMCKKKLDLNIISEITNLSLDEIKKIVKNNKNS